MPINKGRMLKWSRQVRQDRGNKCAICGGEPNGTYSKRIEAHHIEPKEYRPDIMYDARNGLPLCHKCHVEIHDNVFNRVLPNYPTVTDRLKNEYEAKKADLIKCANEHGWTYPANPPLMVI